MKSKFLIIILIFSARLYGDQIINIDQSISNRYLRSFFFPADEATLKEKALIRHIEEFCSKNGITYRVFPINGTGFVTESVNIEMNFTGSVVEGREVVVVTHLNPSIVNGSYADNSLSISSALNLALRLKQNKIRMNVKIVFAGCGGDQERSFNGIREYLKQSDNKSRIILYLNLLNNGAPVIIGGSHRSRPLSPDFIDIYKKTDKMGLNFELDSARNERILFGLYETGLFDDLFGGYHLVSFESLYNYNYGQESVIKDEELNQSEYLYQWLVGIKEINRDIADDNNYLYYNIAGFIILVREAQLLIILSILVLVLLIYGFFKKTPLMNNKHFYYRVIPSLVIIYLMSYLFGFIFYGSISIFEYFAGIEKLSLSAPFIYCLATFFCSFLSLGIFFDIFFKKNNLISHRYYAYSAVFFSFFLFIITMFINITLSIIYLIICFALLIVRMIKKRLYRILILFAGFTPLIYEVFVLTSFNIYDKTIEIISNPVISNFYIITVTFPLYLIFIFYKHLFVSRNRKRAIIQKGISILLITIVSVLILYMNYLTMFRDVKNITTQYVNNRITGKESLKIISNYPGIRIRIKDNNNISESYVPDNELSIDLDTDANPLNISYSSKRVGLYQRVQLELSSVALPEYVDIYIIGDNIINPIESDLIYDNVDYIEGYELPEEEKAIHLINPRNPPTTQEIELTLFTDIEYRFIVVAKYMSVPGIYEIIKPSDVGVIDYYTFIDSIIIPK